MDPHADQAARRLAEVAACGRELASRLARADSVVWRSLAAEAFRAELAGVAATIAQAADGAELASAAVHRHAAALTWVRPGLLWPDQT